MKVAWKLILAMLVILVTLRLIEGVYTVGRETRRLEATLERDAALLGAILGASVEKVWRESGPEAALRLIEAFGLDTHPVRISWVPDDDEEAGLRGRVSDDALTRLRGGKGVSLRRRRSDRGEVQYSYIPVDVTDADGAIQVAEALEGRSRYVRHALVREIVAGAIITLAGAGAMFLLGFVVIGRPLDRLRQRVHDIGDGRLAETVVLRGHDELSMLARGLNDMCEKLSASREREAVETEKRLAAMDQVRHMERLTTIGRLASGVAHELGTPINVIGGRAGMIADGTIPRGSDKIQDAAHTITSQAERMAGILRRLLDFARQRPPRRVNSDGVQVVRQAVELVDCLGYDATVRIESHGPPDTLAADMDPGQMQQVMTNLIENALQAMPSGGYATVGISSAWTEPPPGIDARAGRYLLLEVRDQGGGISEQDLASIFDPFFTTKDVGQGTGLGLSIAYGIVREHGGWIDAVSEVGKGSCFTVHIPQETTR